MPIGTGAIGSFPPKLFQNQPPDQPQLLATLPTVMIVGVGPWVCTLPCSSAQLSPSYPIWSFSLGPAPISCSLGGSVHCPCALLACALPGCATRVHCPCALPRCHLCARPGHCSCSHGLGVVFARGLGAVFARGLSVVHVHAAWALPVRAAWTLPVRAQPDHGITPMITHRCVQALNAPCPK